MESEKLTIILKDTCFIGYNAIDSEGSEQLFQHICEGTISCQTICTAGCDERRLRRDESSGTSRRLSEECLNSSTIRHTVWRVYMHKVGVGVSAAPIATVGGNCAEVTYIHT